MGRQIPALPLAPADRAPKAAKTTRSRMAPRMVSTRPPRTPRVASAIPARARGAAEAARSGSGRTPTTRMGSSPRLRSVRGTRAALPPTAQSQRRHRRSLVQLWWRPTLRRRRCPRTTGEHQPMPRNLKKLRKSPKFDKRRNEAHGRGNPGRQGRRSAGTRVAALARRAPSLSRLLPLRGPPLLRQNPPYQRRTEWSLSPNLNPSPNPKLSLSLAALNLELPNHLRRPRSPWWSTELVRTKKPARGAPRTSPLPHVLRWRSRRPRGRRRSHSKLLPWPTNLLLLRSRRELWARTFLRMGLRITPAPGICRICRHRRRHLP